MTSGVIIVGATTEVQKRQEERARVRLAKSNSEHSYTLRHGPSDVSLRAEQSNLGGGQTIDEIASSPPAPRNDIPHPSIPFSKE